MSEGLEFERTTKPASNAEVELIADEILALLERFESPKDAGAALTLAHFKMITRSFPPEFVAQAIESVDATTGLIKEMLGEGWK